MAFHLFAELVGQLCVLARQISVFLAAFLALVARLHANDGEGVKTVPGPLDLVVNLGDSQLDVSALLLVDGVRQASLIDLVAVVDDL